MVLFLNFYDVTLSDSCGLSVWVCMSCVTNTLYPNYSFLVVAFSCSNSGISLIVIAVLTLLNFSRMVRPGGRGRGGNDPPPPPDYMVGMMQQFELNRQFMENIRAQFPQQNQNGHPHQNAAVNLHDFTRLNPT